MNDSTANADHDAVGDVAERHQQRAERDRQRMLGRRPVGLEGQLVEAEQLAAPQQRVVRVVVRIGRVGDEEDDRREHEHAEADALHDGGRQGGRPAPRRGSLGGRRRHDGGGARGAGNG